MIIAVYADFRSYELSDLDLYFVKSLINNLSDNIREQKFYLITQGKADGVDKTLPMITVSIKPGLLYNYRLNKAVEKKMKEVKADILLPFDIAFKTTYPQFLQISSLKIAQKFSIKGLQNIKNILVPSEAVQSAFLSQYKIDPQKIKLVHGGPSEIFHALPDERRNFVKEKYADGKEYFIYRGSLIKTNNIIPLLKAFSFFKKRQKSTMKIVLLGTPVWDRNEFQKLLDTYKYREDVVVVNNTPDKEAAELIASAYAYVQPYAGENLLFAFDAMQCQVPVLADEASPLKTIAADAAAFCETSNENDLAHKMMWVYKDEALRSQLIERGNQFIKAYSWQKTTGVLRESLRL